MNFGSFRLLILGKQWAHFYKVKEGFFFVSKWYCNLNLRERKTSFTWFSSHSLSEEGAAEEAESWSESIFDQGLTARAASFLRGQGRVHTR